MLNNRYSRRGFALLELVVVVVVLLILAAVLFPIFARLHETEHRPNRCQNNMKQLALGFKQYLNDFNERYPLIAVTAHGTGTTYAPPYGWADALQPYIRNTQVYQCPSDTNDGSDNAGDAGFTDYWYNANFIVQEKISVLPTTWIGVEDSTLGSSAQTIIAGDGGNTNGTPTGSARYNQCGDGTSLSGSHQTCAVSPEIPATYPAAQIHLDGANFAFADGHVKWLRGNNATQSAQVINNGATQKSIGGKVTFSLLTK